MATQGSSASAVSRGGTGSTSTPANNVGDSGSATNRRSSGTQNTLFSGLVNQKRNSTDAAAKARKESFSDQKPATGIIGKMWNK
ncbi:hypothetical protein LCER1_G003138 [Lachnellula cervina]|uniref:Conidiation-specific protein 8 n=1 Tax=Lachnellula cervina TaxID=1316786 RepID=A0A7D8YS79_9HELO|nr:hypothetical protein LCER1_G003138 [Lachnellula cervina]